MIEISKTIQIIEKLSSKKEISNMTGHNPQPSRFYENEIKGD